MLVRFKGRMFKALGVLDPGSEATLITCDAAESIGLNGREEMIE